MKDLAVFNYGSNEVRVIEQNGEPWFVAKDVCDALKISNSRKAVSSLDDDEKANVTISDGSQKRYYNLVSEPGLYSLIMKSRKPEAKKFTRWVTHEVLPQIRKTGQYLVDSNDRFAYWGGILDKARKVIEHGDKREISLIEHLLQSAVEMLKNSMTNKFKEIKFSDYPEVNRKRAFAWNYLTSNFKVGEYFSFKDIPTHKFEKEAGISKYSLKRILSYFLKNGMLKKRGFTKHTSYSIQS